MLKMRELFVRHDQMSSGIFGRGLAHDSSIDPNSTRNSNSTHDEHPSRRHATREHQYPLESQMSARMNRQSHVSRRDRQNLQFESQRSQRDRHTWRTTDDEHRLSSNLPRRISLWFILTFHVSANILYFAAIASPSWASGEIDGMPWMKTSPWRRCQQVKTEEYCAYIFAAENISGNIYLMYISIVACPKML